jgi:hypothetical protein
VSFETDSMKYQTLVAGFLIMVTVSLALFWQSRKHPITETTDLSPQSVETPSNIDESSNVDWKATFLIYTNNTRRVFSDAKYHNQSAWVYLESVNPAVVNIRSAGVTWGNFFASLPMELTTNCLITGTGQTFCSNENSSLKFYLNGESINNVLDTKIRNGDKLLVSYGPIEDSNLQNQLTSVPDPHTE